MKPTLCLLVPILVLGGCGRAPTGSAPTSQVHPTPPATAEAENILQVALRTAPEDDAAHCALGIVYCAKHQWDEAINELTKALAINPKNALAHHFVGFVAEQKGWPEAARKEREIARALDSQRRQNGDRQTPAINFAPPSQNGSTTSFYKLRSALPDGKSDHKNFDAPRNISTIKQEPGVLESFATLELEVGKPADWPRGDSAERRPVEAQPVGDFLTPLEKKRLRVPTGRYEPAR